MKKKHVHHSKVKSKTTNKAKTKHKPGRYIVQHLPTGRYYILRQYSNIVFNSIAEFEAWHQAAAESNYSDNPTIIAGSYTDGNGNYVSTREFYTWDDNSYVCTWTEVVYPERAATCNTGIPASYDPISGTWYCLIGT